MPESSSAMTAPSATLHAVQTGPDSFTGYLYDAEGHRVAKGTLPALTCDPAQLQVTAAYFIGPDGETMTEIDSNGSWGRTEVTAAGHFLATYTPSGIHYPITDWLGTKRISVNPNLTLTNGVEETCASFPFGDQLNCNTPLDASSRHFTGKERDTESGLDYFGARYYASSAGRFSSPDPSGLVYADPTNPQSLNLYAYVWNNPLHNIDSTGLAVSLQCETATVNDWYINEYDGNTYVGGTSSPSCNAQYDLDSQDISNSQILQLMPGSSAPTTSNQAAAPNNGKTANQILQCASKVANQFSIAGVLGINEETHPVGAALSNAFLGNTFSGISDTITHVATGHFGAAYADFALGGTAQGLPIGMVPAAKGIVGVVTEGALGAAVGEEMATPVGWAKLGIDAVAYAGSLLYCKSH